MFKTLSLRSAVVLALTVLAAPLSGLYAQSAPPTQPQGVTGGDPQPIGNITTPMVVYVISLVLG